LNYVRALSMAWNADKEWIVSTTSIAAMHHTLMQGVRGQNAAPGQFRDVPVFIGGPTDSFRTARFVPPPPYEVQRLLDNLNAFIAGEDEMPVLVKLAIAHYQFETIHPFRDGNGRLGRMLIPLHLKHWDILDYPLLYISEYFERYRETYIDLLYRVSKDGDWEGWVNFFLDAVTHQSQVAIKQARMLLDIRDSLRARYEGERSAHLLTVIDGLFAHPSLSTQRLQEDMGISKSTANLLVRRLGDDGVLTEITGKQRYKIYVARPILDVITAEFDVGE
jgi:Fic family protein